MDQRKPSRRKSFGRRLEHIIFVSRQQCCARGDALGISLSRRQGGHGHGHRQCRHARGVRRDSQGTARTRRGCAAQPPARCDRAFAGTGRALQGSGRQEGRGGSFMARRAGRETPRACLVERHRQIHRRGHRRGPPKIWQTAQGHRRPVDGRHGRRRRPLRRGQDVPAAGRQVGARDEKSGGMAHAVHGGRKSRAPCWRHRGDQGREPCAQRR